MPLYAERPKCASRVLRKNYEKDRNIVNVKIKKKSETIGFIRTIKSNTFCKKEEEEENKE